MKKSDAKSSKSNADAADWREKTLSRMRTLILKADPEIIEERKWKKPSNGMVGVPVWSRNGIICTGETYKNVVKLTFAKGASLSDSSRLFNASLEGNMRRAIDIHEGETIDASAFTKLVKAAIAENSATKTAKPAAKKEKSARPAKLLSGGNPQIAKADGDAPVQAFIAAMPGWKRDIGKRLDALITANVPNVRKAIKWNTPFYGVASETGQAKQSFFLGFHCVTKYIKVAFFKGASLRPVPPEESKQKDVRYFHIHEDDHLDEKQLASWIKQAAALPGWAP